MTGVQQTLDLRPLQTPEAVTGATIDERYAAWKVLNPWVLSAFVSVADEMIGDGLDRIGAKHIAETLRWRYARQTTGDVWKINNSFVALIARDMIAVRPDLGEHMTLRERKTK